MSQIAERLAKILALEEHGEGNLSEIETECAEVIRIINTEGCTQYLGTIAYRYAEDFDVRIKSQEYAAMQREQLHIWLNNQSD